MVFVCSKIVHNTFFLLEFSTRTFLRSISQKEAKNSAENTFIVKKFEKYIQKNVQNQFSKRINTTYYPLSKKFFSNTIIKCTNFLHFNLYFFSYYIFVIRNIVAILYTAIFHLNLSVIWFFR